MSGDALGRQFAQYRVTPPPRDWFTGKLPDSSTTGFLTVAADGGKKWLGPAKSMRQRYATTGSVPMSTVLAHDQGDILGWRARAQGHPN